MKLIIDIPKELKQKIDEGFTNQVIINKLWDATRNGTPLDKIRAEIERKANSGQWSEATIYGMQKSIAIIDKYREDGE